MRLRPLMPLRLQRLYPPRLKLSLRRALSRLYLLFRLPLDCQPRQWRLVDVVVVLQTQEVYQLLEQEELLRRVREEALYSTRLIKPLRVVRLRRQVGSSAYSAHLVKSVQEMRTIQTTLVRWQSD